MPGARRGARMADEYRGHGFDRTHRYGAGALPARRRARGGAAGAARTGRGGRGRWDPARQRVDAAGLAAARRWCTWPGRGWATTAGRTRTRRSCGTAGCSARPRSRRPSPRSTSRRGCFVCGSAIGYYGDTGDRAVDESAPPGDGFLASLCVEWEEAAAPAQEAGIRTVFAAYGPGGGPPGRGLGRGCSRCSGRGSAAGWATGSQYWSFIALHDEVAALRHLIDTESLSGPVNLTGPEPVDQPRGDRGDGPGPAPAGPAPGPRRRAAARAGRDGGGRPGQPAGPARSGSWRRASRSPSRGWRRRSGRRRGRSPATGTGQDRHGRVT